MKIFLVGLMITLSGFSALAWGEACQRTHGSVASDETMDDFEKLAMLNAIADGRACNSDYGDNSTQSVNEKRAEAERLGLPADASWARISRARRCVEAGLPATCSNRELRDR
jgi:hypothetical protein